MEASGQLNAPATLPLGRVPNNNYVRDFVGPGDGLDVLETNTSLRQTNQHSLVFQPAF